MKRISNLYYDDVGLNRNVSTNRKVGKYIKCTIRNTTSRKLIHLHLEFPSVHSTTITPCRSLLSLQLGS